jgi:hypothetical protein
MLTASAWETTGPIWLTLLAFMADDVAARRRNRTPNNIFRLLPASAFVVNTLVFVVRDTTAPAIASGVVAGLWLTFWWVGRRRPGRFTPTPPPPPRVSGPSSAEQAWLDAINGGQAGTASRPPQHATTTKES